jgi:hypothetical protein
MPTSTTPAHIDFKCLPCAGYSTDRYSGEKSAIVYTVNVNDANTDGTTFGDKIPGEIWIGTADDSGNHKSDGHKFTSRPSGIKFWYRYDSQNNETFAVNIILKDAAGNVIARVEKTDGKAAGDWTQAYLPIVYSNNFAKAANIYISFKSSVSGDISMNKSIEVAGKNQSGHIGSVLRIDDIELIY